MSAQNEGAHFASKLPALQVRPVINLQLWSTYTVGQKIYSVNNGRYVNVQDRLNFQLRRSRLGVKGRVSENISFNLTAAIDLVGRDLLSGTEAGSNNGASPGLRLWNGYLRWRVFPEKEGLNVVAGYFVPQIGRESMTSAFRSTSLEKSWSQNYLRRHLTGTGPGRSVGFQLGGILIDKTRFVNWGYNVAVFNPAYRAYGGNSAGEQSAALFVARLETFLGEPESEKYTIGHKVNYFGKRRGLTLALAAARQGETDLYESSGAAGLDLLLNLDRLHIDGEWTYLFRKGSHHPEYPEQEIRSGSQVGYLRIGYNIPLRNHHFLEPVFMVFRFEGVTDRHRQAQAGLLAMNSGYEQAIDLGGNYYFNANLKLSLHYTFRRGEEGEAGPGSGVNNLFYQGGVGAIHRGDWLGLGMVAIF